MSEASESGSRPSEDGLRAEVDELVGAIRQGLKIGRSHLPLFASNERTVSRARLHLDCIDDAETTLDALAARVTELENRLRAACESCAECGHIDWRELDDCLPAASPVPEEQPDE